MKAIMDDDFEFDDVVIYYKKPFLLSNTFFFTIWEPSNMCALHHIGLFFAQLNNMADMNYRSIFFLDSAAFNGLLAMIIIH